MKAIQFTTSLLFFWIKGQVEIDSRFVKTNVSNTILGFIPAGKDQQSIPLKNISGAILSTKFNIKAIIIGLILAFIGLGQMGTEFFIGFILFIIGLLIAANGILTTLSIEKSGTPYFISVPFFEKAKMQNLSNDIHNALAQDTDKTDLNLFFEQKTQ